MTSMKDDLWRLMKRIPAWGVLAIVLLGASVLVPRLMTMDARAEQDDIAIHKQLAVDEEKVATLQRDLVELKSTVRSIDEGVKSLIAMGAENSIRQEEHEKLHAKLAEIARRLKAKDDKHE